MRKVIRHWSQPYDETVARIQAALIRYPTPVLGVLIPGFSRYLTEKIVVDVRGPNLEFIAARADVGSDIAMSCGEVKVSDVEATGIICWVIVTDLQLFGPIVLVCVNPKSAVTCYHCPDCSLSCVGVYEGDLAYRCGDDIEHPTDLSL